MYKVIHYFTDMQDFDRPYHVGDVFPRNGMSVSDNRLAELSSKNNRQGKALIELVKPQNEPNTKLQDDFSKYMQPPTEESKVIANKYNKTIINRMSTSELKDLAKENGIDGAMEMTGGDLKKVLIEKFQL